MFRAEAICAKIVAEEIGLSIPPGGMICFKYDLVLWGRSGKEKSEVKDAQNDGVEASRYHDKRKKGPCGESA